MKLAIIAATGGVGRQLLSQALAAGHDVTAVARNPARLPHDVPAGRPGPPGHDPGDGFLMRHAGVRIAKPLFGKVYQDLAQMEDILRESGLDWTILRPPQLTGKPLTGHYRTAYGRNVRGGRSIPRADVARYMLTVTGQPETIGQVVGIAAQLGQAATGGVGRAGQTVVSSVSSPGGGEL